MENNINLNSLQNVLGNMLMSSNGKSSLPQGDKNNKEKQDADVVLAKVSDYRRESQNRQRMSKKTISFYKD